MRTKKALLNFITDVLPLLVVSILGIYKLKYFIMILGDEVLGLYQLFTQVMVYVALVDGGLSSAVLYALYKPNVDQDTKTINMILAAARKIFSLIGIVVFAIAAVASFIIPFFIKDQTFPYLYVSGTFILFSLSNVVSYFFVPYNVLIEVKEKKYIANLSLQIGQIVQNILEIVLLLSGWSFLSILVMHSIIKLISNLIIYFICKKMYPEIDYSSKEKDYSFTKQVKHLVFHKINGLVGSNIDVLIISKLLGLASVAIYSTYNYIVNMLKTILGKISGALLAIIGNSLNKNTDESNKLFLEINSMMFYVGTVICVPLTFALNKFIEIWYEGTIKTDILVSIAFTLYLLIFIIKQPVVVYINAAGLFKETKKCALTDTLVNLTLSLTLVWFVGIPGVLFATAISVFIAEYIMKGFILYKKVFNLKASEYYLKNIKFFIILIIDSIIATLLFTKINIDTFWKWLVIYSTFTAFNALFILLLYTFIKENKFLNRIKIIFSRGN